GGDRDAEDDDGADRLARGGARTAGEHQGHGAGNGGDRGHDDRPEAARRGVADRAGDVLPGIAQLIGELDDQYAVLGGQADQHDDADLAVEIEGLAHQGEADDAAANGERDGGDDHRRVDEAFELGGEQQVDDEDGEQEDDVDG